jgi:hypothetical protein
MMDEMQHAGGGMRMDTTYLFPPIPYEMAVRLCAEIRAEADRNWYTPAARWCWNCQKSAGGDPAKRGFLQKPGNRGCTLINARFAELRIAA